MQIWNKIQFATVSNEYLSIPEETLRKEIILWQFVLSGTVLEAQVASCFTVRIYLRGLQITGFFIFALSNIYAQKITGCEVILNWSVNLVSIKK